MMSQLAFVTTTATSPPRRPGLALVGKSVSAPLLLHAMASSSRTTSTQLGHPLRHCNAKHQKRLSDFLLLPTTTTSTSTLRVSNTNTNTTSTTATSGATTTTRRQHQQRRSQHDTVPSAPLTSLLHKASQHSHQTLRSDCAKSEFGEDSVLFHPTTTTTSTSASRSRRRRSLKKRDKEDEEDDDDVQSTLSKYAYSDDDDDDDDASWNDLWNLNHVDEKDIHIIIGVTDEKNQHGAKNNHKNKEKEGEAHQSKKNSAPPKSPTPTMTKIFPPNHKAKTTSTTVTIMNHSNRSKALLCLEDKMEDGTSDDDDDDDDDDDSLTISISLLHTDTVISPGQSEKSMNHSSSGRRHSHKHSRHHNLHRSSNDLEVRRQAVEDRMNQLLEGNIIATANDKPNPHDNHHHHHHHHHHAVLYQYGNHSLQLHDVTATSMSGNDSTTAASYLSELEESIRAGQAKAQAAELDSPLYIDDPNNNTNAEKKKHHGTHKHKHQSSQRLSSSMRDIRSAPLVDTATTTTNTLTRRRSSRKRQQRSSTGITATTTSTNGRFSNKKSQQKARAYLLRSSSEVLFTKQLAMDNNKNTTTSNATAAAATAVVAKKRFSLLLAAASLGSSSRRTIVTHKTHTSRTTTTMTKSSTMSSSSKHDTDNHNNDATTDNSHDNDVPTSPHQRQHQHQRGVDHHVPQLPTIDATTNYDASRNNDNDNDSDDSNLDELLLEDEDEDEVNYITNKDYQVVMSPSNNHCNANTNNSKEMPSTTQRRSLLLKVKDAGCWCNSNKSIAQDDTERDDTEREDSTARQEDNEDDHHDQHDRRSDLDKDNKAGACDSVPAVPSTNPETLSGATNKSSRRGMLSRTKSKRESLTRSISQTFSFRRTRLDKKNSAMKDNSAPAAAGDDAADGNTENKNGGTTDQRRCRRLDGLQRKESRRKSLSRSLSRTFSFRKKLDRSKNKGKNHKHDDEKSSNSRRLDQSHGRTKERTLVPPSTRGSNLQHGRRRCSKKNTKSSVSMSSGSSSISQQSSSLVTCGESCSSSHKTKPSCKKRTKAETKPHIKTTQQHCPQFRQEQSVRTLVAPHEESNPSLLSSTTQSQNTSAVVVEDWERRGSF